MQRSSQKQRLRSMILERRREMPFEEVFSLSQKVQERFLSSPYYKNAGRLALYSSFRNEVLTEEVFRRAVANGKAAYFPRVVRGEGRLAFFRVLDLGELHVGSYEIREPESGGREASALEFDLVVVPGAAFDMKGARLGYGKGYYDRALERVKCPIAAFAFDFQVTAEDIPLEDHDVRVSMIVTEKRTILIP